MRGDKAPQTYTRGEWPFDAMPVPDAPVPVHYSLALARTLAGICTRREITPRALSLAAGLAPNAVGRIVRGELYPNLATLARLEAAVREPVYPYRAYLTADPPNP